MSISYRWRWKEKLVGSFSGHEFVVEMTMGRSHVYFPTENRWLARSPDWAAGEYENALSGASSWCEKNGVQLTVDEHAWVKFSDLEE